MEDRELLELAAKAAGLSGKYDENGEAFRVDASDEAGSYWWSPHEDDGDALRLAVKLGMHVCPGVARDADGNLALSDATDDVYAATRDAIVMAAAEIGRARK